MPKYSRRDVNALIDGDAAYTTCVETGTFKGTTALKLAEQFERVYTIEIDEKLHQQACNKFASKGTSNITALLGDSREILRTLVPELCADGRPDKAVFWLVSFARLSRVVSFFSLKSMQDAHWAGDESVDWSSSKWKGYGCNTGFSGKPSKSDGECAGPPSSQQQVHT